MGIKKNIYLSTWRYLPCINHLIEKKCHICVNYWNLQLGTVCDILPLPAIDANLDIVMGHDTDNSAQFGHSDEIGR